MFDPNKPPLSLAELAQRSFTRLADSACLGTKDKASNEYKYLTYAQVAQRVRHVAGGLMKLGLARGERAAILAENSAQWAICDLACQMLGAISVPLFSTLPPGQVGYILRDSGAKIVFVSDAKQLKKIEEIRADLPDLQFVVAFDVDEKVRLESGCPRDSEGRILSLDEIERSGEEHLQKNPTSYESTWPAASGNDIATIIYTSGTTGDPKGVALSHLNIIADIEALIVLLEMTPADVFLSFLPLAHVYERTAGFFLPLRVGASIAYCESLFTVDKNLREARPTLMFCVPRLLESMREKLFSAAKTLPENQKAKYLDALTLAQKYGAAKGHLDGAPNLSLTENLKFKVCDAMVYSKIRDNFGGRLRAFVSGGAPLAPEMGALFGGVGLPILEGYGLTETSPVIAVNRPGRVKLGSVGEPVNCVEIKIADDGEILVRGASVFTKYWNKPDETREALQDGWFHTGDIGLLENGYLKITDRKKDLLVLGNGKKVAPAPIELRLQESAFIAQAVLLGDKAKSVSALIVPKMDALREWMKNSDAANGAQTNDADLLDSPAVNALLRREVESHSGELANFEKIRAIHVLAQPFSVEAGELTPTLKIKRRVIAEKYAQLLEK